MKSVFLFFVMISSVLVYAQDKEHPILLEEEAEDGEETVSDKIIEELFWYRKHPLNINSADAEDWIPFRVITPLMLQHLSAYRQQFGNLVSIYELQAVPGWRLPVLVALKPYLTVDDALEASNWKHPFSGSHQVICRYTRVLEKQKGFLPSTQNGYLGDPGQCLVKYRYKYLQLLDWGFVSEKDAGEPFFKKPRNTGFDFYSFHVFLRHYKKINAIAVGDFTVNMGQGLVCWQAIAFTRSFPATMIKREASVLLPYTSSAEYNFERGAGITVMRNRFSFTGFYSSRQLNAPVNEGKFHSIQTAGLNRTVTELKNRNSLREQSVGGNIQYRFATFNVGGNIMYSSFSIPFDKGDEGYNYMDPAGSTWMNASIDYGITYKSVHFFGETAVDKRLSVAIVQGMLLSPDKKLDVAVLFRKIHPAYRSFHAEAFTAASSTENETGLYMGATLRPYSKWQLECFADFYRSPYIKYQSDRPSVGADYAVKLIYQPMKISEFYCRFRVKQKENNRAGGKIFNGVESSTTNSLRVYFRYDMAGLNLKTASEIVRRSADTKETGFLVYLEGSKALKTFEIDIRAEYFQTGGFDTRIYIYESDVLYGGQTPFFDGEGYRIYLNLNKKLGNFQFWGKLAQTIYRDKKTVGSGLEESLKPHRTSLRLQFTYTF